MVAPPPQHFRLYPPLIGVTLVHLNSQKKNKDTYRQPKVEDVSYSATIAQYLSSKHPIRWTKLFMRTCAVFKCPTCKLVTGVLPCQPSHKQIAPLSLRLCTSPHRSLSVAPTATPLGAREASTARACPPKMPSAAAPHSPGFGNVLGLTADQSASSDRPGAGPGHGVAAAVQSAPAEDHLGGAGSREGRPGP